MYKLSLRELLINKLGGDGMVEIDTVIKTKRYIEGKWVVARPVKDPRVLKRLIDAFLVFFGKAEAVSFYKQ
jgi:hypothetical protein